MQTIKQNKILITILLIITIGFFTYNHFSDTKGVVLSDPTVDTTGEGILGLLEKIQSVQIDNTLFTSSIWLSLKDFSVQIPNDPPGKSNLFGPLGQTQKVSTTTTGTIR